MRRVHEDVIGFSINYSSNYILPIVSINNPRRLILSTVRNYVCEAARDASTCVLAINSPLPRRHRSYIHGARLMAQECVVLDGETSIKINVNNISSPRSRAAAPLRERRGRADRTRAELLKRSSRPNARRALLRFS